jgi:hypothetical protein
MATEMQKVEFWLNDQEYNDAVKIFGGKSKLYGVAKNEFLKKLKEQKEHVCK